MPAVVLCTSGTAAANFHPAVLEAHHARVPLIVCTADRPPELRDTGAGQTVDQAKLYGGAVRWFCDAGRARRPPGRRRRVAWRSRRVRCPRRSGPPPDRCTSTCRSGSRWCPPARRSSTRPAGPTGARGRHGSTACARRRPRCVDALAELVGARPRAASWSRAGAPTCRAGDACSRSPTLPAGRCSPIRCRTCAFRGTISTYDPLLRVAAVRRRLAARSSCSASARRPRTRSRWQWLDPSVPQVLVDPDDAWLDPTHAGERPDRSPTPSRCSARSPTRSSVAVADGLARGVAVVASSGAGRDRRAARRLGDAVRGPGRARRRRRASPTAARSWSRRACPSATSRASPRHARACTCTPTAGSTASTASSRPRSASRRADRRPTVALARRPVPAARHQRPARRGGPGGRRHVRRGRQRRWRHLLVPPAGRPARALRAPVRHAPGRRPRRARGGARRPDRRGRRRRRAVAGAGAVGRRRRRHVVRVRTDRATNVVRHREVWAAVAASIPAG